MKSRDIVILLCGLLVSSSFSQALNYDKGKAKHSLHKGSWALQFALTGSLMELRMIDYMGSFFSGKYHFSDKRALRLGVEFSGSSEDRNSSNNDEYQSGFRNSEDNRQSSSHYIALVFQHLWYLRANNNIHFYMGIGPDLSWRISNYSSDADVDYSNENDVNSSQNITKKKSISYYLGFQGSIGVELFTSKNLSLLVEFYPWLGYSYLRYERNYDKEQSAGEESISTQEIDTTKVFNYRTNEVKLGLSFYF